jgi:hypothetical protein
MTALAAARPRVTWATYAGLFVITMATLMYEILLTRIFSVTMWYHFAFVAISVALFGMTVGALIVYLQPERFPDDRVKERLTQASLAFSVAIVVTFITQLSIPFEPEWSVVGVYSVTLLYFVTAVPFVFSGVVVALALTRFPERVNRLYAADLIGAALGALTLIWLLSMLDGPSAVVAIAALVAAGAGLFAYDAARWNGMRFSLVLGVLLAAFAAGNAIALDHQHPILRIVYAKGRTEPVHLYEQWNAFSRIQVDGDPDRLEAPWGWGMSPTLPADVRVRQLFIYIDAFAGTVMTRFDGDLEQVQFLRYDVTNLVHHIRRDADQLVIGSGGGRDVLSALVFGQRSVEAVEINGAILHAVNDRYGDFTGHLERNPKVRFVNDEARSYVARTKQQRDIIQISLIDTFAATAAGAFALSENGLYTIEAWDTFLDRLTPTGVLSVSRVYLPGEPVEMYRLVSLASATLCERGVDDPRAHLYVVKNPRLVPNFGFQIATLLISPQPFAAADLRALDRVVGEMQFDKVLTPDDAIDDVFDGLGSCGTREAAVEANPWDISAPTDDHPFFFQQVRLRDFFDGTLFSSSSALDTHMTKPVRILAILTLAVLAAAALFIVLPLALRTSRDSLRGMAPYLVFFAAIGLAFLLIEIAQMQRLMIFLGHPTYALSVVLFSLLLASGAGSFLSERLVRVNPRLRVGQLWPFVVLLIVVVALGMATPAVLDHFEAATTPARILTATLLLLPIGLMMGMPFPIGMRAASASPQAPTVFFWGINGATSVTASVLAVSVALTWGISTAFWLGAACYLLATAALAVVALRRESAA